MQLPRSAYNAQKVCRPYKQNFCMEKRDLCQRRESWSGCGMGTAGRRSKGQKQIGMEIWRGRFCICCLKVPRSGSW